MHKEALIRNFSRYADKYDAYAHVQRMAAVMLLDDIDGLRPKKIMEFGCGTGNYTVLLREKFPDSSIKALDFSGRMVEIAEKKLAGRGVDFFVADAETAALEEKFDLITSNACVQWFADPGTAMASCKNMLGDTGAVVFSVFGPRTFCELNESLDNILEGAGISAGSFLPKAKIEKVLADNFRCSSVKEIEYKEPFSSLSELLNKIKYTGTRGLGLDRKGLLSAGKLKKLEEFYLHNFLPSATYQIFICKGIK